MIFRMEILQIKGGKKRTLMCEYGSADMKGCDENEKAKWEKYSKSSTGLADVTKEVDALKAKTKQTLKKGEHDVIKAELSELKPILKALKKLKKKDEL